MPAAATASTQQQQTSIQQTGGDLRVGEFVVYEGRAWKVGLVNFSRARLDPMKRSTKVNGDEFAGSVNIGPASTLRRLSAEEAAVYGTTTKESDHMSEATEATTGDVAGVPIPPKANRVKVAKTRKATGSTKTATKQRAAKREPAVADKPCKCGCGGKTASHFIAGHDARFKGWLLKIERGQAKKEELLKKAVIAAYQWKRKGKGEIPTLNYKGEKHTGYESTSEA